MGLAWIPDTEISQSAPPAPLAGKETESLYSILFKYLPPQVYVTPEALAVPSPRRLQVIENYVDHPGSGLQQHTQSFNLPLALPQGPKFFLAGKGLPLPCQKHE